jgi:hypothetical protein
MTVASGWRTATAKCMPQHLHLPDPLRPCSALPLSRSLARALSLSLTDSTCASNHLPTTCFPTRFPILFQADSEDPTAGGGGGGGGGGIRPLQVPTCPLGSLSMLSQAGESVSFCAQSSAAVIFPAQTLPPARAYTPTHTHVCSRVVSDSTCFLMYVFRLCRPRIWMALGCGEAAARSELASEGLLANHSDQRDSDSSSAPCRPSQGTRGAESHNSKFSQAAGSGGDRCDSRSHTRAGHKRTTTLTLAALHFCQCTRHWV